MLGAFTISSGLLNSITYTVKWNGAGAGHLDYTGSSLTAGTQSAQFDNADTGSATCSGGGSSNDTARVIVGITDSAMHSAASSATAYTGTLTMLITPY